MSEVVSQIGIMQGRLSPRPKDRLQAFPWMTWQQEFALASECGFDTIEWLFEADDYERNPLLVNVAEIERLVEQTGVMVRSVCADYFMIHPLFRGSDTEVSKHTQLLNELILNSARIGVEVILIPVLEIAEVRTEADRTRLIENLQAPLSTAQRFGIKLALETELPAKEYRDLVLLCEHESLGVYYDAGNAAARGYDIAADIRQLDSLVCGVHLKDRKLGGTSVLLGEGDANFATFFSALSDINYQGPLILQSAFGEDHIGDAKRNLAFVRNQLHPRFAIETHVA